LELCFCRRGAGASTFQDTAYIYSALSGAMII
jgi:hypothetical protein